MVVNRQVLTAVVAGVAALGLTVAAPSGVASAAGPCKSGDRNAAKAAAKAPDMHEIETVFVDGSIGRAQITLRYAASQDCAWGLLEGTGEIWIEQKSPDGTFNRLYTQRLDRSSITHTAPVNPSSAPMRVCGGTFNGSDTTGSSNGTNGTTPNSSDSGSSERSFTQPRCTQSLGGPM